MTYREPARTTTRRIPRILVADLLVVIAVIAASLGYQLLASSSWTAVSPIDVPPSSEHHGALGEADGAVPDGTTVFDDEIPVGSGLVSFSSWGGEGSCVFVAIQFCRPS